MFMREPTIATGFIIFREGYEKQLTSGGKGHWKTARDWVENSDFREEFHKMLENPDKEIHDYDDFLTDYVGAIRLYSLGGRMHCYIPFGNNNELKFSLKKFFSKGEVCINNKKLYYHVHGDFEMNFVPIYNQTVLADGNGVYYYNPNRIGD